MSCRGNHASMAVGTSQKSSSSIWHRARGAGSSLARGSKYKTIPGRSARSAGATVVLQDHGDEVYFRICKE